MFWPEALMAIVVLLVAMGWYPCCCQAEPHCTQCSGYGDNTPQYCTVEVSGVANDTCTDCGDWNGTWVVENGEPSAPCTWYADGPELCSGGSNYASELEVHSGTNLFAYEIIDGDTYYYFGWHITFYDDWNAGDVFDYAANFTWDDAVLGNPAHGVPYTLTPCHDASGETFTLNRDDPGNLCDFSGATVTLDSGDTT